ncbi:MAG: hypothetical protein U0Q18_12325 [Bryobacteraceae bacterium]
MSWLSGGQTAFSPNGRHVVYLSYPEHDLLMADVDGGHQHSLLQGEVHGALARWSPDGRYIAFLSWRGATTPSRIRIVSPDGQLQVEPVSLPGWQGAPGWLSDHEIVFGENGPKFPIPSSCMLHVFDWNSGRVEALPGTSALDSPPLAGWTSGCRR